MRSIIKREVERDCMGRIAETYTTIYIKGTKNDSEDDVWRFASQMTKYIEDNTNNKACCQETGEDKEVMVCTDAYDRSDYEEVKYAYTNFKREGAVLV